MSAPLLRDLPGGAEHPLFDGPWYTEAHREVSLSGVDPFEHFSARGSRTGLRPNPLFDPNWYLSRYAEVREAEIDPFLHFVHVGERAGYRPNPLFDTRWYRARHSELESDDASPLARYIEVGAARNDAPNALFRPVWYREHHHVDLEGWSGPLHHYLELGAALDLSPHPLFDAAWYRERYPEVEAAGRDPFEHYLNEGSAGGYWPNPLFDTAWYREQHMAAEDVELDPLLHFEEIGAAAGYRPHPLFDTAWYRDRYPVVARSGANPLAHYLEEGMASDRQPNPLFDPAWYRAQHVALRSGARAPILHYMEHEQAAGTAPNPLYSGYASYFRSPAGGIDIESRPDNPLRDDFQRGLASRTRPAREASFEEQLEPEVSIIVPAFNQVSHTVACLRSIASTRNRSSFEVIVADDSSSEVDYATLLGDIQGLRVWRSEANLGFVRCCNAAATRARGSWLVFLNNDTIVTDGWLDALVDTDRKFPRVGLVGSKLVFPNGRVAEAGGIVWRDGSAWNYGRHRHPSEPALAYAREADYVSAASLLVGRELFEELGGFDEAYAPAYYEDTDLAFRVRAAGYQVLYQPASEVIHFEGVSLGIDLSSGVKSHQQINHGTFYERWREHLGSHREPGQEPHREKDRAFTGRALVLDVCTPSPTRDARSIRLLNMMTLLRDEGFKVTFLPENLDAPEPFLSQLGSHGIEVLHRPHIESIGEYLRQEGERFELCVAVRPALAERWLGTLRRLCPNARILFDAADLMDPSALPVSLGGEAESDETPLSRIALEADASTITGRGDDDVSRKLGANLHILPRIFDGCLANRPLAERQDVFVVTGAHGPQIVDSLLWLCDEILPLLARTLPELRLHLRADELARTLVGQRPEFVWVDERELTRPGALTAYRLAIAPARIGPGLAGPMEAALACGLPCVATPGAAREIPERLAPALTLEASAEGFAEAIGRLHSDAGAWAEASRTAREGVQALFSREGARRTLRQALGRDA